MDFKSPLISKVFKINLSASFSILLDDLSVLSVTGTGLEFSKPNFFIVLIRSLEFEPASTFNGGAV